MIMNSSDIHHLFWIDLLRHLDWIIPEQKVKKFLIAIFATFYLSTSIGAIMHFHFCMDKLVNWDFGQNKQGKCDRCGMNKSGNFQKHGCCNDVFKTFKNQDQKITESTVSLSQVSYSAYLPQNELQTLSTSPNTVGRLISIKRPRSLVAINILNCIFLI